MFHVCVCVCVLHHIDVNRHKIKHWLMDWSVGCNRVCTYVCVYAHCYCYTDFAFVIEWFLALCFIEIWRFIVKCIECFMVMMSQKAAMGRVYINLNGCLIYFTRNAFLPHEVTAFCFFSISSRTVVCTCSASTTTRWSTPPWRAARPVTSTTPAVPTVWLKWCILRRRARSSSSPAVASQKERRCVHWHVRLGVWECCFGVMQLLTSCWCCWKGGVFTGMFCWEYGSVVFGSQSCYLSLSCWHHVGVVGEVCSLACSVWSMGMWFWGHRAVGIM